MDRDFRTSATREGAGIRGRNSALIVSALRSTDGRRFSRNISNGFADRWRRIRRFARFSSDVGVVGRARVPGVREDRARTRRNRADESNSTPPIACKSDFPFGRYRTKTGGEKIGELWPRFGRKVSDTIFLKSGKIFDRSSAFGVPI
jgi:hypothetical protein